MPLHLTCEGNLPSKIGAKSQAIMYRRPAYPAWMTTEARSFIDTALHKVRTPSFAGSATSDEAI